MKYPFAVGGSSDPVEAVNALRGLRAMARLGRIAEKALADIAEKGHYQGRVPFVTKISAKWLGSGYEVDTRVEELLPLIEPRMDLLCPMEELHITLGEQQRGSWGGREVAEVPVFLCGPMKIQYSRGRHKIIDRKVRIGVIRLNVNDPSFVDLKTNAFKLYKSASPPKAERSVWGVACAIAPHLLEADADRRDVGERPGHHFAKADQLTTDMVEPASKWLVDGGHAARLMMDMYTMIPVLQVMTA